jgi:hypothetical protein
MIILALLTWSATSVAGLADAAVTVETMSPYWSRELLWIHSQGLFQTEGC